MTIAAAAAVLKGYVSVNLGRNATIVIEVAVGLAVGMAAQLLLHLVGGVICVLLGIAAARAIGGGAG